MADVDHTRSQEPGARSQEREGERGEGRLNVDVEHTCVICKHCVGAVRYPALLFCNGVGVEWSGVDLFILCAR